MVGLKIHHNGVIRCGVANGSSPGLSHVVETRKGQGALGAGLASQQKGYPMHILHAIHTFKQNKEDQGPEGTQDTLLSLAHFPSRDPPGQ